MIQEEWTAFYLGELYGPVTAHETLTLFLGVSASEDLITERCDVDNAYLFGDWHTPTRMQQPTNFARTIAKPGNDVLLIKSLYGTGQAATFWGNEIHGEIIRLNFQQCFLYPFLYFLIHHSHFIILCIIVYDIASASNSADLMKEFKDLHSFDNDKITIDIQCHRDILCRTTFTTIWDVTFQLCYHYTNKQCCRQPAKSV